MLRYILKWQKIPFLLFNDMADLIEGTYVMGKGVVQPGSHSVANSFSNSLSDEEDSIPIDPVLMHPPSVATTPSSTLPTASESQSSTTPSASSAATGLVSNKWSRNGNRKAGSHVINGMMASIHYLANSLAADTTAVTFKPLASPECKHQQST